MKHSLQTFGSYIREVPLYFLKNKKYSLINLIKEVGHAILILGFKIKDKYKSIIICM